MATQEQFAVILNRIDAATNDIAQDLLDLKDQIEGQGLPQDVEDSILASLDSAASRLEAVAAENPETPTEPEV